MIIASENFNGLINLDKFLLNTVKVNIASNTDSYRIVAVSIYERDCSITLFNGTEQECQEKIKEIYNAMRDAKYSFDKEQLNVSSELNKIKAKTNYTCKNCGKTLETNDGVIYTSNPPKIAYKCKNCGNEELL